MGLKMSDISQQVHGIPPQYINCTKFTNGGSESLAVNGSVTPVDFTLETLAVGQNVVIQSVDFLIAADTSLDLNKFGNVPLLTNGLLFHCDTNERVFNENGEMMLVSQDITTGSITLGANSYSYISAKWNFPKAFGTNGGILTDAANVKITVRDDLSTLPYFKVVCHCLLIDNNI